MIDHDTPRPGEVCSCGEPAYVVYLTELYGRVGWCGQPAVPHDINEPSIRVAVAAIVEKDQEETR